MERARARRRAELAAQLVHDPDAFAAWLRALAERLALLHRLAELRRQGRPTTDRAVRTWIRRASVGPQSSLERCVSQLLGRAWTMARQSGGGSKLSLLLMAEALLDEWSGAVRALAARRQRAAMTGGQASSHRKGRRPDLSDSEARRWQAAIAGAKVRTLLRLTGEDDLARREDVLKKLRRDAALLGITPEALLDRKVSHSTVLRLPSVQALLPGSLAALSRRLRRARRVSRFVLPQG